MEGEDDRDGEWIERSEVEYGQNEIAVTEMTTGNVEIVMVTTDETETETTDKIKVGDIGMTVRDQGSRMMTVKMETNNKLSRSRTRWRNNNKLASSDTSP